MRNFRFSVVIITLALLAASTWLAVYAYDQGFTNKWRRLIKSEFAKRGIEARIGKLTLDPIEGLVARDIYLYDSPKGKNLLASINRITLDIDLSKLMREEQFLQSIDFRNASLSLPLNPEDPESQRINIDRFSARILLPEDKIEIRTASGEFYGVEFNLRGSLIEPRATTVSDDEESKGLSKEEKRRQKEKAKEALETLKKRRGLLNELVNVIKRFDFKQTDKPRFDMEVYGDLDDLENIHAIFKFEGSQISHRFYSAKKIRIHVACSHGEAALKELEIRDAKGTLQAQGFYKYGSRDIEFNIDSNLDPRSLVHAFSHETVLEDVFFYQPPKLSADGTVSFGETFSPQSLKWDVIGKISTSAVRLFGADFDAIETDFRVKDSDFILQDVMIGHETGTLAGKAMRKDDKFRYNARLKMSPLALLPLVRRESTRKLIEDLTLDHASVVVVDSAGVGDFPVKTGTISNLVHTADFDLREVKFRGERIQRLEFSAEIGPERQIYQDIELERSDGRATANRITYHTDERTVALENVVSNLNPIPIIRIINPELAERLKPYHFVSPPVLQTNGVLNTRDPASTTLAIELKAPGPFRYTLAGHELEFQGTGGTVSLKDEILTLLLVGKVKPDTKFFHLNFRANPTVTFSGEFGITQKTKEIRSTKTSLAAEAITDFTFAGKQLPIGNLEGSFVSDYDELKATLDGDLFDGTIRATTDVKGLSSTKDYSAKVTLGEVSFNRLARVYAPDQETVGEFTAGFSFTGQGMDTRKIVGNGHAQIFNGNLYAIPTFGPLSKLISKLVRKKNAAHSIAREASMTFSVADQKISTNDFEALTKTFKITGNGVVDYSKDRSEIDFDLKLNGRGASGLFLFPVSKLLEYTASGELSNPQWKSRNVSSPRSRGEDKNLTGKKRVPGS